jgi:hypothetical protein
MLQSQNTWSGQVQFYNILTGSAFYESPEYKMFLSEYIGRIIKKSKPVIIVNS